MFLLKLPFRVAALPVVLALALVQFITALITGLSSIVTNLIGTLGIATAACIASGAFQRALAAACPETEVVAVACPAFVPLIESGHYESGDAALRAAVAEYLAPLREKGVGSLILGCTHYGLIEEAICGFMGPGLRTIEAAECAARELALWLRKEELCGGTGEERFFTSGSAEDFERLSAVFLGRTAHGAVEHVDEMEV